MSDHHSEARNIGFIDLHQDMLSGVERLDGDFPAYGSNHLTGQARAAAIWSSMWPHDPGYDLLAQLDAHDTLMARHSERLRLITTVQDLDAADARIGVLPHSEGLELPGIEPEDLHQLWFERSLRSLALTWNYETDYACSCYDDNTAPLKPAGRRLVKALEDSPLQLDLAHLNERGFYDVLELYAPPVLVTHSFCRAIGEHPRGLTDAQLRALGDHGGLIGVTFVPDFLGEGSIDEALRHIDHIVSVVGENAISVGTDWGVTDMGEIGGPASLVKLFDAVAAMVGPRAAEKFAIGNAEEFLRAQLPLTK